MFHKENNLKCLECNKEIDKSLIEINFFIDNKPCCYKCYFKSVENSHHYFNSINIDK